MHLTQVHTTNSVEAFMAECKLPIMAVVIAHEFITHLQKTT